MEINIGERIAYFRTSKGLTINRLANKAGVSQSYLREIEMGRYSNPSVDVLDVLCGALGISLREFFDTEIEIHNIDDSLLKEIAQLTPEQRENLTQFLKSVRN